MNNRPPRRGARDAREHNEQITSREREHWGYHRLPVDGSLADERGEERAGRQVEELREHRVRALLAALQKQLRLLVGRTQLHEHVPVLCVQPISIHRVPLDEMNNKS